MDDWVLDCWKSADKATSSVKKAVAALMKDKVRRQQFTKLVLGVQEFGPEGFTTKGNKHLGGRLYELRDTSKHTRYYYCETSYSYRIADKVFKSVLLLLVADGDKDKQQMAIEQARSRMSSVTTANLLNDECYEILED